ncbi:MAG: glycyl-tRNA synthetase beta chain [Bradymonadia bacterium]|jgi:glycyl-tRNA synthetase beta chain
MILLFEIGTEELPAGEINPACEALAKHVRDAAKAARLSIGDIRTLATPRRLTLIVKDVAPKAETIEQTLTGPAARIAFDDDGNPTRAALGFARGKGIDPADLIRIETAKGAYVAAIVRQEGEHAKVILSRVLNEAFGAIPWKRSMRWGWSELTFARPVHWIIAMLDSRVLEVSFAGVDAGDTTYGHRFMSPGPAKLATASQYEAALSEKFVIADVQTRVDAVLDGVTRLAAEAGLTAIPDMELAAEVAHLVEWPVPLLGTFSEDLLEVPREVLVTSMRSHQKYFAFEREDGTLANNFAFVSNMAVEDPSVIVRGNQRVLLARLEDAKFFFREDRKHALHERVPKLSTVRYIDGLGSILDRTGRIEALAATLSKTLYPGDSALATIAGRAAHLCKADLISGMVYEFATLQGTMGRYYALLSGETHEVAAAIEEHYSPRGASDAPPASAAGVIVSLADKLEAIVGCFALGLVPSGSADPYALRRAALGILRTCMEHGLRLPLEEIIRTAAEDLPDPADHDVDKPLKSVDEIVETACDFIYARLRALLAADYPKDIADAVVTVIADDLPSAKERCATLDAMRKNADFDDLAKAFKRAVNIIRIETGKDESLDVSALPNAALFEHEAELGLANAITTGSNRVSAAIDAKDFESVGAALIAIKPAIDAFFDGPMVNVDDQDIRLNRLRLLDSVRALFQRFADISRIQVDGK